MTAIKVQMQTTAITAVSEQQGSIPNCSPPHCPGFNKLKKEKGKRRKHQPSSSFRPKPLGLLDPESHGKPNSHTTGVIMCPCVCPPGLAALLPMANFLVISPSNNSLLGCFPAIISAAEGEWQQEKCWTKLAQL